MASTLPVQTILYVAKICEYLAANDVPQTQYFRGGALDNRIANMIYMERMGIQKIYDTNPADPTLVGSANYLFAILGKYAIAGLNIYNNIGVQLPVITGPDDQNVAVGADATFVVSVTSALPVLYQWFRDGVVIPGATDSSYVLHNAQLSDSASLFSVSATNSAGSANSRQALLTVTATITGYFSYGDVDPGPALQANTDPFTYQTSYSITHNADISIPLSAPSTPNKYLIAKVPSSESAKVAWFNTPLNNGAIPDSVYQTPVTFGGFTYYYTRVAVSMDISQPLVLS